MCSDIGATFLFQADHSQAPILEQTQQNCIGRNLARLRLSIGWTQEGLAREAQLSGWDLDRSTVSKIEAGLRRVYDQEIWHLSRLLKCEMSALYPADSVMKKNLPPTLPRRKA